MSVIACDMTALNPVERERRKVLAEELFRQTQETRELEGGYAWRYSSDSLWMSLAEFVGLEHRCCPFLNFALELDGREMWLRLSGPEGAKDFLRAKLQGG